VSDAETLLGAAKPSADNVSAGMPFSTERRRIVVLLVFGDLTASRPLAHPCGVQYGRVVVPNEGLDTGVTPSPVARIVTSREPFQRAMRIAANCTAPLVGPTPTGRLNG
jgi:hypothetical protein